jgi:uroporphyrinogen-III decarboxylase
LKHKYGDRLTFWGGGVDTQGVMAFGSPSDVEKQVKEQCSIFGPNGGFVFNAVHNIQANTPIENVVAMFEAVRNV